VGTSVSGKGPLTNPEAIFESSKALESLVVGLALFLNGGLLPPGVVFVRIDDNIVTKGVIILEEIVPDGGFRAERVLSHEDRVLIVLQQELSRLSVVEL